MRGEREREREERERLEKDEIFTLYESAIEMGMEGGDFEGWERERGSVGML